MTNVSQIDPLSSPGAIYRGVECQADIYDVLCNANADNGSTVSLSVFGNANSPIRVTLDGSNVLASSPLYTSPLHFSTGGQLRAATDMVGLAMSRELAIDF